MSDELIKLQDNALLKTDDQETFDSQVVNVGFLPTLKLYNASANAVKKKLVQMAHYGLASNKDTIKDLGESLDIIPITHRYKAVEKVGDKYLSYYNPDSDNYNRTKEKSKDKKSGCLAGIEFLVWIPSVEKFALWYAANTSTLSIAKEIRALYLKPATLKANYIETKDYSWHAPVITVCSTQLNVPSDSDLTAELTKFRNPKEAEVEVDNEGESRTT